MISQLVKMRLKTKTVINLYLNGVKELIGLHPENLATILKHTIYNELSNARNQNNMPMLGVMFQTLPEQSAKLLAEIFQDLLMNREDYLRPLRALLREIVRVCRHDINLLTFARTLMGERQDIAQQLLNFEFKERVFISIADRSTVLMHVIGYQSASERGCSTGTERRQEGHSFASSVSEHGCNDTVRSDNVAAEFSAANLRYR